MLNWDTGVKAVVPAMLGFQICKTAGYMGLFFLVLKLFQKHQPVAEFKARRDLSFNFEPL